MAKNDHTKETIHAPPMLGQDQPLAIQLDLEKYTPFLEDNTISDEDKIALVEALWNITVSFVKLGYGVHPVQQAKAARQSREKLCGQFSKNGSKSPLSLPFRVDLEGRSIIENFDTASAAETVRSGKEA